MAYITLKGVDFSYRYFPSISGGLLKSNSGLKSHLVFENFNLEINDGDRVALLGVNGAGKSTLLKIMAGVYTPEQGQVSTDGKIYSFFGRSIGVMPQLSGLENLEIRGLLLNLPSTFIQEKIEEIIEFTELGDAIYRPVSTYSMGMKTRLTFGMLMFVEADIMLIDEGLGAGDKFFLEKAQKFIEDLLDSSKIMVFANHSMELVKKFCNKAILIDAGEIVQFGDIEAVISRYNHLRHIALQDK
ncbi:ABC transporter ATP-binding protein [Marinicella gelatinilytica]|uniref:ABC transporter ATP-binding protein n=1 Tax=Marinicella gelatinilytica TaxID=2996017 RepID=UPI002260AFB6|nr:ATP-binding cassette domain-containing protein [Marinicella gelatinilytica]MCX7544507.1 ATP-binding cassette domain-containing protein [Marinicella gelatinilytica]